MRNNSRIIFSLSSVHAITIAGPGFLLLLLLLIATTRLNNNHEVNAFMIVNKSSRYHNRHDFTIQQQRISLKRKRSRIATSSCLHAIEGAAKNSKEDVTLTIKVIMDHHHMCDGDDDDVDHSGSEKIDSYDDKKSKTKTRTKKTAIKDSESTATDTAASTTKTTTEKPEETTRKQPEPTLEKGEQEQEIIKVNREFRFVDKLETNFEIKDGQTTICCARNGLVMKQPKEITLTLSPSIISNNDSDNDESKSATIIGTTPEELYADTSTEMAIKLAQSPQYANETKNAVIIHNQYDTGAILTVWACLEPELALQYKDLLIEGAEAGEFQEWTTDNGVKLDSAIQEYRRCVSYGMGTAFVTCIQELFPTILQDLIETGGVKYKHLWSPDYNKAISSWNDIQNNDQVRINVIKKIGSNIVTVERPWMVPPISPYALHRKLKSQGIDQSVQRILYSLKDFKGARFDYYKPGHGWVQKLIKRTPIPPITNVNNLLKELNEQFESGNWKKVEVKSNKNDEDETVRDKIVAICQSTESMPAAIEEVAEFLAKHDDGLQ